MLCYNNFTFEIYIEHFQFSIVLGIDCALEK